tara:strand:- start:88 stop:804 length:717 start_codon:yes stop_codon:yes gene_type:complete
MRKIIILLLVCIITKAVIAAAPPIDTSKIPKAPYIMEELDIVSINVEWDVATIKKLLPPKLGLNDSSKLFGGISIFSSKKKQFFSPLSGALLWVQVDPNKNQDIGRWVFYSTFGPNTLINRIMNELYRANSSLGSSRVTVLDKKIGARANVNKKNIINASIEVTQECEPAEGQNKFYSYSNNVEVVSSNVTWTTKEVCPALTKGLKFGSELSDVKVVKYLSANFFKQLNLEISNPSKN